MKIEKPELSFVELAPMLDGHYCEHCEEFVPQGRHFLGLKNWYRVPYCSMKCHKAAYQKVREEKLAQGLVLCTKQHPVHGVEWQNDGSWECLMPSYQEWYFSHTVECLTEARFRVASSKRNYCQQCLPKTAIRIVCLCCETEFQQGACCGHQYADKARARQRLLALSGLSAGAIDQSVFG